jgi:hypothetical protein
MEVVPLARERTNEPGIGIESPEGHYISERARRIGEINASIWVL